MSTAALTHDLSSTARPERPFPGEGLESLRYAARHRGPELPAVGPAPRGQPRPAPEPPANACQLRTSQALPPRPAGERVKQAAGLPSGPVAEGHPGVAAGQRRPRRPETCRRRLLVTPVRSSESAANAMMSVPCGSLLATHR